jgi:hypothetical protein
MRNFDFSFLSDLYRPGRASAISVTGLKFRLSPENIFAVPFSPKLKSRLTELPQGLIKWSYRPEQVSIKSALLRHVKLRHGPVSTERDSK